MSSTTCRQALLACSVALLAGTLVQAQAARERALPPADAKAIAHVLNRMGFGPSAAAADRVRRLGIDAYIEEQLHPERIADAATARRLERFASLAMTSREIANAYYIPAVMARRERQQQSAADSMQSPNDAGAMQERPRAERADAMRNQRIPLEELTQQKILRAAYSGRQLEEVLVDFWFNHFNVFAGKGPVRVYLTEYERDAIRPHVLGKFRDLLGATARSPAMLFYLDNWQSTAAPAAPTAAHGRASRARRPARVRRMPPDGTPRQAAAPPLARRRGINENYARELLELHTLGVDGGYTQKDVQEVARAFTGWTITTPRQGGEFRFDPRLHDDGEKVVLGRRIKAGGGQKDGEQVLDLLARHPSTARFIATKLARRFVSDDPPRALVDRAADRFLRTDGDIREVVKVIVTSPEFFAPEAYRAKVKSPFEFVVSAVRALDVDVRNPLPLARAIRDLGMPLYGAQPPTGYSDRAATWVNAGALLNRMNFALALAEQRLRTGGTAGGPMSAATPAETAERLVSIALAGDVTASTAGTVAKATTPAQAAALVLGSPEFQKR